MCIYIVKTRLYLLVVYEGIYCIRHNYMFRPLMLVIFRLYMDLSSSYTTDATYVGCFLRVGNVFVWDRDLVCVSGGWMVWNRLTHPTYVVSVP